MRETLVVVTLVERERNDARNASGTIQSRFIEIGNYPRSVAERDEYLSETQILKTQCIKIC